MWQTKFRFDSKKKKTCKRIKNVSKRVAYLCLRDKSRHDFKHELLLIGLCWKAYCRTNQMNIVNSYLNRFVRLQKSKPMN